MSKDEHYRASGGKVFFARLLTSAPIGLVVQTIFRNRIRNNGLVFDTSDPLISQKTKASLFFRTYESAEIRMVRKHLNGVSTIVDLGASLGFAASHAIQCLGRDGRLIAVEANPELLESLRGRVESYSNGRRVDIIHAAISGSNGVSFLSVGESTVSSHLSEKGVQVQSRTLSSILKSEEVDGPFALMMDIEGAEYELLTQDANSLSKCVIAIVEFHSHASGTTTVSATQLLRMMQNLGFSVKDSYGPVSVMTKDL